MGRRYGTKILMLCVVQNSEFLPLALTHTEYLMQKGKGYLLGPNRGRNPL